MAYCPHCGNNVQDGTKYCTRCGKELSISDPFVRKQVYQGEVRKCPSCGAEVPSFTAICPECGHELNSARVTSSIQGFTQKLHEYDTKISNTREEKTGWSSWGTGAKIGWVILNMYTLCIPLAIYSVRSRPAKTGTVSQQKASFIENYVFPNDREAVLEALLFIKSQLTALLNNSVNGTSTYWCGVWSNKATQLYQKASVIMPNDAIAEQTYADVLDLQKQFKKKRLLKSAIIIGAVFILFIIGMLSGSK